MMSLQRGYSDVHLGVSDERPFHYGHLEHLGTAYATDSANDLPNSAGNISRG